MSSFSRSVPPARRRWALWSLYSAAVVVLGDMYLTQPVLPRLSREFGIPPATAGWSISAVVLCIALTSLASGPLSDRLGRQPVMAWSCGLLAGPTLLCALAGSFPQLLAFRALQGVCIPGVTAVAVAYLSELVEPRALGRAVGGWIAANVAGGLLGRLASGLITDLWGWRAAFGVFAALTLGCAIFLAAALPRDPPGAAQDWRRVYAGLAAHLRSRRLVGAFLIGGALFFGFLGVFTYLPYYLTSAPFFLPAGLVAFAYLSYLAGVLVSPVAGRLSERFPRRTLIAVGLIIAMLGVALSLVPALPAIALSLLILCTGMFTAQAVAPAFVNTLAVEAKGGAGALYLMFYYVGGTLGGVWPGLAWQAFGWPGVAAACLGAFLLALFADGWLCRE